jgi:hypothetical protein
MSNTILIKRSGSANAVPASGNLSLGELAINYQDGNLFYKDAGGTVQTIASKQFVSVTGNITGGNVLTNGIVSAVGNVTGNYILGNGYFLTGVITSVANINNGTSNITVVSSGGNITVGVGGTGNVAVFATTGEYITGLLSASGNVTGGNLLTAGLISATSTITSTTNITGGNVLTGGQVSATGNVTGGNVLTGGQVSATGNVTGGNLLGTNIEGTLTTASQTNITLVGTLNGLSVTGNIRTDGFVSATGNVTAGNVRTVGLISATGNVTSGNILTVGLVSATGNVTGNYFIGNGSQLTDIRNISNGTSNVEIATANGNVTITANAVTYTFGTNSTLTLPGGSQLRPLGANLDIFAGTGSYVNLITSDESSYVGVDNGGGYVTTAGGTWSFDTTGNLTAPGNISAVGNIASGNVLTGGVVSATGNVTGANINVGNGNVNVGNVVFALDSSKFNSAKWTLVETINADLTFGDNVVATTNSYSYYASNYNEVLYLCGAGGNGGTITIPVSAVSNNSQWRVNDAVGIKWANIANASITVVDLQNPLTTVTVTMYVR